MRTIRFYREENLWYADLPEYIAQGGTKEDCLMVAGADDWLEFLCDDGKDEVTLAVSDEWMGGRSDSMELEFVSASNWATYTLREYRGIELIHTLDLCPVSTFVFGVHPKRIYYKKIS